MKTVLTQSIDGYDIIIAFDEALVDPEATKNIVAEKIPETPEYHMVEDITTKLHELAKEYVDFRNKNRMVLSSNYHEIMVDFEERRRILSNQLAESHTALQVIKNTMAIEYAIYFIPKAGEFLISDEEYEKLYNLLSTLPPHSLLTKKGAVIDDYRGVRFVNGEGAIATIHKIGITPSGELFENLTEESQKELLIKEEEKKEMLRISLLSDTERAKELETAIDRLTEQSVFLRQKLEATRTPSDQALEESQNWLDEEIAKTRTKYKKPE